MRQRRLFLARRAKVLRLRRLWFLMRKRCQNVLKSVVQSQPVSAYVFAERPNIVTSAKIDKFAYLYEVLAPEVQIEDLVGSFALTVSLPAASYGAERASSEDQVTWTSSASGLQIENTVRRVAVQVEVHDGSDAGWQPATKVGPNGVALRCLLIN